METMYLKIGPIMDAKYFSANNHNNVYLGSEKIDRILRSTNFKLSDFNPYLPILNKRED